ncbi:histidinol-phosphate transaminase [Anaeromicropila populeti]|uniref:Histidinol-phosphate aminotransferase n=1 Tax=Anaeromicropila populeti TaxID=37658 RepID=A0A1I6K9F3_9FIRM|nr:histidinol-phosphate transaminase [Anaeromicropila populeti]SFR87849.1 histidinol-phosphate aminotransferase [Anaeromicropila populeti]
MEYKSPYKGVNQKDMVCLATNENSHGLSEKIYEEICNDLKSVNRYPKVSNGDLKQLIANRHGLMAENVVLGSGSDELILYIALKYVKPGDNTIMANPSFFRYKDVTEIAGGSCKLVDCINFEHDLETMKSQIDDKTKIVFLCNPNNPTGTFMPIEKIEDFVKDVSPEIMIVVDEAYFDFVAPRETVSAASLLEKYSNIIVLRTFSKFFALAGLRIGYAVGCEAHIKGLDAMRSPYNVNSIAQAAALKVLEHLDELTNQFYEEINTEREYYYSMLDQLNISYIPSSANFIFIKFGKDCLKMCEQLKDNGIIIRPCDMFGYPEYVRITIGTREENEKLFAALKNIIEMMRS